MECTRGHRQSLRCWRLVLYLALTLAVADHASTFDAPSRDDREVKDQPNGSVRIRRGRSALPSSQLPAVSVVGPVYSFTSASVRCVLLNASGNVASPGKWYWSVLYPAAGARSHLLTAVANKTIALALPGSLRGNTAVSHDGLESIITLFNVQRLRSHVNVSCQWRLIRGAHSGAHRHGSNAQTVAKSAIIYGESTIPTTSVWTHQQIICHSRTRIQWQQSAVVRSSRPVSVVHCESMPCTFTPI